MMNVEMLIKDEAHMLAFAQQFAQLCSPPLVIYLSGSLGAGKTTFSRGFLKGLDYAGKVKSPTYTLVEPYLLNGLEVFHFDFYRIYDAHELELIGIRDYFHERAICLIEWPEQGRENIPRPDMTCAFHIENTGRRMLLSAASERGAKIYSRLVR